MHDNYYGLQMAAGGYRMTWEGQGAGSREGVVGVITPLLTSNQGYFFSFLPVILWLHVYYAGANHIVWSIGVCSMWQGTSHGGEGI